MPYPPGLFALFTIATLRNATLKSPGMLMAEELATATMLPICPGMARIVTFLLMDTVPVLKLAESSIQISPPSCTAPRAAGRRRHGDATVHGLVSNPYEAT